MNQIVATILYLSLILHCLGFINIPSSSHCFLGRRCSSGMVRKLSSESTSSVSEDSDSNPSIESMRLREIQAELRDKWKVSYSDCFDKESLITRLKEARSGQLVDSQEEVGTSGSSTVTSVNNNVAVEAEVIADEISATASFDDKVKSGPTSATDTANKFFDRKSIEVELRQLRIKELREKLAARNIRWGNMIEKQDLVRALADAMEAAAGFSVTGLIAPGEVAELTGEQLDAELGQVRDVPLLLDVYATWCGPCQLMQPHLKAAAEVLGDSVRVAKIDSDKYGQWSSKFRVGGLPTILLFDGSGKEIARQEGAVMSDDLIKFARQK